QRFERKFVGTAALPQKIGVDVRGNALRRVRKCIQPRLIEPQQHRRRLDLAALAVRRFDLQRRVVVGENDTDFEITFFFVENVHAGNGGRAAGDADYKAYPGGASQK